MADELFELVKLRNGLHSLRAIENQQIFHPGIGPEAEALRIHVEPQNLSARLQGRSDFEIWDVGLGAGANAITAWRKLQTLEISSAVTLKSFDRDLSALEFALRHSEPLGFFGELHSVATALVKTGKVTLPSMGGGEIRWQYIECDFTQWVGAEAEAAPSAIMYDPYSNAVNRDMWTLEHFARLYAKLAPDVPCLLTNYSRSTAIRVTLLLAGFQVGRGDATGEKEETTEAANDIDLLRDPLGKDWLERVARSSSAAPIRVGDDRPMPINEEDFASLRGFPQFQ